MIDINKIKQGDVLEVKDNDELINSLTFISKFRNYFIAKDPNGNIDEWTMGYIKSVTSWKRDGVELLKQEEEGPLYVFCPIDKVDSDFLIEYEPLNKYGNVTGNQTASHIEEMNIGVRFGDYTFIGYSTNNEKLVPAITISSPLDYCFADDFPKVVKYAVFMLTSKLHVGGER